MKHKSDIKESIAPKIAENLLKWLMTFFKKSFLKDHSDLFMALSLPLNLFTSWLLPDDGLSGQVSSIMMERFPAVAKARLEDWDNAKNKLFQKRLKDANRRGRGARAAEVTDADYDEFKGELKFPNRDASLAELRALLGDMVDKLNNFDFSTYFPDFSEWEQKLADLEIDKKLDDLKNKINTSQQGKPLIKKTGLSRLLERIATSIDNL